MDYLGFLVLNHLFSARLPVIQNILSNLFYDILNIEFNLWPWARNMCKYGDFFLYLILDYIY